MLDVLAVQPRSGGNCSTCLLNFQILFYRRFSKRSLREKHQTAFSARSFAIPLARTTAFQPVIITHPPFGSAKKRQVLNEFSVSMLHALPFFHPCLFARFSPLFFRCFSAVFSVASPASKRVPLCAAFENGAWAATFWAAHYASSPHSRLRFLASWPVPKD